MANSGNIDPYLGVLLRKCKEHPEMEEQYKAEYLKSYADVGYPECYTMGRRTRRGGLLENIWESLAV